MSEAFTTHGAPSWIEHHGTKPQEARQFYESVLGWSFSDLPMKDGSSYPGIMVGEGPVGGISPHSNGHTGWLLYITVDDVDDRHRKAVAAGAETLGEPVDIPGVGRIATIRDPFGASLAFITYAPEEG